MPIVLEILDMSEAPAAVAVNEEAVVRQEKSAPNKALKEIAEAHAIVPRALDMSEFPAAETVDEEAVAASPDREILNANFKFKQAKCFFRESMYLLEMVNARTSSLALWSMSFLNKIPLKMSHNSSFGRVHSSTISSLKGSLPKPKAISTLAISQLVMNFAVSVKMSGH